MIKAIEIRNVLLKVIDLEGIIYDMTHEDYNTIPELREALSKLRDVNQILMNASIKESFIEEKQQIQASEIKPSVKPKFR